MGQETKSQNVEMNGLKEASLRMSKRGRETKTLFEDLLVLSVLTVYHTEANGALPVNEWIDDGSWYRCREWTGGSCSERCCRAKGW